MPELPRLFHHQWSLAVLVGLRRGQAPAMARQTLADTLDALSALGLVSDGALTRKGERVAERGEALLEKLGSPAPRKWALPIVHALGRGPSRFGDLKSALPGATPRAISMALKDLIAAGLVD